MFWYKQKSAPKKGALGARSEACSLTTTLGHRTPWHERLSNVSGGCEGTAQPFFVSF